MSYTPRLKDKYTNEIVPEMQRQFNYKSSMQVPRLVKICLNQGIGDAITDKKLIDSGNGDRGCFSILYSYNGLVSNFSKINL